MGYSLPDNYVRDFFRARLTFRYHKVYDPTLKVMQAYDVFSRIQSCLFKPEIVFLLFTFAEHYHVDSNKAAARERGPEFSGRGCSA